MAFTFLRPILYTKDIRSTIEFYTGTLGFLLLEYNEAWQWASLKKDEVEIMLGVMNEHIALKEPGFSGSLYINVSNVNELWEQLQHKANICYAIDNFDWEMREFAIYDNNGYVIQFGQPVASL
ncbi:MAG: VOC family protein [Ferruginibacter sp.]